MPDFVQTEDGPAYSVWHCPCGASFRWSGFSDALASWEATHRPHLQALARARISASEGELSITLPLSPNEDTEITCLYCRRPHPCEYGLTILSDGGRALVGLHAMCLAPLRAKQQRREAADESALLRVRVRKRFTFEGTELCEVLTQDADGVWFRLGNVVASELRGERAFPDLKPVAPEGPAKISEEMMREIASDPAETPGHDDACPCCEVAGAMNVACVAYEKEIASLRASVDSMRAALLRRETSGGNGERVWSPNTLPSSSSTPAGAPEGAGTYVACVHDLDVDSRTEAALAKETNNASLDNSTNDETKGTEK